MDAAGQWYHQVPDLGAKVRHILGAVSDAVHLSVAQRDEVLVPEGLCHLVTELDHLVVDVVELLLVGRECCCLRAHGT